MVSPKWEEYVEEAKLIQECKAYSENLQPMFGTFEFEAGQNLKNSVFWCAVGEIT